MNPGCFCRLDRASRARTGDVGSPIACRRTMIANPEECVCSEAARALLDPNTGLVEFGNSPTSGASRRP